MPERHRLAPECVSHRGPGEQLLECLLQLGAARRVVDQVASQPALRRVAERAFEGRALEQPLGQSFDRLVADAVGKRRRERAVDGFLETFSPAGLDVAACRGERLGPAANGRLDDGRPREHATGEQREASEPQPEVEREGGQTEDGLRAVGLQLAGRARLPRLAA